MNRLDPLPAYLDAGSQATPPARCHDTETLTCDERVARPTRSDERSREEPAGRDAARATGAAWLEVCAAWRRRRETHPADETERSREEPALVAGEPFTVAHMSQPIARGCVAA
jgi:hypothetical protein